MTTGRSKFTLLLCLLTVLCISCRKNAGQPSWNIDALAPLAKTEIGIDQLLPDSILSTNPDHSLDIVYNSEVYNFTLKDFLTVRDTTISSTYFLIPGVYNPGQSGPAVTSQTSMSLQTVQLKTLVIESGKVKFEVYSKVKGKTKMTYTIPKATKNGVPFSATLNVPAGTATTDGYLSSVFDLSDYNFDLRGQSGNNYNTIVTVLTAGIDPAETAQVTIALTDYMTLSSTFQDVIPQYAKGYFGNTVIEVPPGTTRITAFDQIVSGNLKLESLKMKFSLENSIGVDASADIHYLNALNQQSASTVSLANSTIVGIPVHLNRAVENPFSSSIYSVSLDNSNSNAKSFFEILPDQLGYAMKVEVNPLGNLSGGNDFAYLEKGLKAFVDLVMPLSIISDKLTFVDSAAFQLDDFATLHKIISGNLILNITNGFPFEGMIRVMELSEDGTVLDSLFSTNTITAGPLDTNLKVSVPTKSKLLIPLNQTHINHLLKTKKLAFTIQLSTLPENQYVRLYSDYKMGIKVVGDFKYQIEN